MKEKDLRIYRGKTVKITLTEGRGWFIGKVLDENNGEPFMDNFIECAISQKEVNLWEPSMTPLFKDIESVKMSKQKLPR
jgi:hypothetical protein